MSLELLAKWPLVDGREITAREILRRASIPLTDERPTFEEPELRFLLNRYDAEDRGITQGDLRGSKPVVIVRDLVSERSQILAIEDGRALNLP